MASSQPESIASMSSFRKTNTSPVADFAPDTVFHMAALHFIPYCNAHPAEALDVNVLGLDMVIRAVRRSPVQTFVFPSSGAIYGFGDDPWPETAPPRPDEIYGISKWVGEQVMTRFHEDRPEVRRDGVAVALMLLICIGLSWDATLVVGHLAHVH